MIDLGKRNLLGVAISAVDYEHAVAKIIEAAWNERRCITTALAVHGVVLGALDRAHRYRLNNFDLVTPDGQPVRWGLNLLYGTRLRDRVYGPTMTLKVCKEAAMQGIPVYFYGSSRRVLDQLCARLPQACPGLKIAGAHPSEFRVLTVEEQKLAADRISGSGAKIVFVGLGCPRQEIFAYEMSERLSMPMLAVGAAFDYHAGVLREPPALIQRSGLQWLYRLLQDPARLWRRYLFTNSQFIGLFLVQWLRLWRPELEDCDPPLAEVRFG
jgi:N-acetylglucosaminyldiphosphoundecaprenol N-acetyl-beta-D-mannosaminyltransferase